MLATVRSALGKSNVLGPASSAGMQQAGQPDASAASVAQALADLSPGASAAQLPSGAAQVGIPASEAGTDKIAESGCVNLHIGRTLGQ